MRKGKRQNYFDSMGSASETLGIPLPDLKRAKRQGAPGFQGSRVYPDLLLPWLEQHKEDLEKAGKHNKEALTCELLIEKIKIARVDRMKLEGLFGLWSDFDAWKVQKAEQLKSLLGQILKRELPPHLEGLRAPEITVKMEEAIVRITDAFRQPPAA